MIALGFSITTTAMAQVVSGGQVPDLNAQRFRPAIDSARTLWVDDARLPVEGASGRVWLSYHHNPLVYRQGDDETRIVRNIVQADVIGGWGLGPVRVGLDVPIYLLADGQVTDAEAGLGDVGLDGRITIVGADAPVESPVDVGLQARLIVPTATVDNALGNSNLAGQLAVIASIDVGNLLLAANAGTRVGPTEMLENVEIDDAFEYRLGGAYDIDDRGGLSLEFAGLLYYSAEIANRAGSPLEGLLGGYGRPTDTLEIRGAIGRGLTAGVGSPDLRILLGLALTPSTKPEVVTEPTDFDEDGLSDDDDSCPAEAEDLDAFEDEDGCPDPTTEVVVRVVNADGKTIRRATLTRRTPGVDDGAPVVSKGGEQTLDLLPETWTFEATAPGYQRAEMQLDVTNGPPRTLMLPLDPSSQRIVVEDDRIDLRETVQFQTASARLLRDSLPLLDDVARILKDNPQITKVSIEGHTDSRGNATTNQRLSARRAQTVLNYLVNAGVAADRLQSQGFGESQPRDDREVPEAWESNRRVEIRILAWSDDG